jgi:two-component sensor histidine kinase
MLVQGVGAGRDVKVELEQVLLAGHRATALALVFSELLGNALEHGGQHVNVSLHAEDGEALLEIADDGPGIPAEPRQGTGLSIVRALVRDELGGTLDLRREAGTRAQVRFPA